MLTFDLKKFPKIFFKFFALPDVLGEEVSSFLTELTGWPIWKETWKDGSQRKNFAGIDYTYDETRNAFISPKRYPSWIFNESTCQWDPPTPFPDDGKKHIWNESEQRWDEI